MNKTITAKIRGSINIIGGFGTAIIIPASMKILVRYINNTQFVFFTTLLISVIKYFLRKNKRNDVNYVKEIYIIYAFRSSNA